MWQTKCTIKTLNADVAIKVIIKKKFIEHLKNATSNP